jgi:phage-related protein
MIQLYKAENKSFECNGDMTLIPSKATVHVVMNGAWETEIEHPIDKEERWRYIKENAVVKMPSFNGEQLFRIKKKRKSDSGVAATLEPIFFDAKDDCFLTDIRPTKKNGK